MTGISAKTDCTVTCSCKDPAVERLRALIAAGHDQFEASRLVFSDVRPTSLPLLLVDTRHRIRASFKATFPWLRLPTSTGPEAP